MKIDFDQDADAAYLILKTDAEVVFSKEMSPGVVYDFDEREQVIGIEILKVKHRTPAQFKQLNFPFSAEDKSQLKGFFSLNRYTA